MTDSNDPDRKRPLGRRELLLTGTTVGLAASLGALWLRRGEDASAKPETRAAGISHGTAELVPDPEGILDLQRGFRYSVLEQAGEAMDDGWRVPALADGMACFEGRDGRWVLMRNHEVDVGMFGKGPFPPGSPVPREAYDPQGAGGVTRVVIDPKTLRRVSSNLVLAGTARNCAGGPSPWGWLSCEESDKPGHGFVFLCPVDADRVQPAQRIQAYGRFSHEAVAIDPSSFTAYLTEDKVKACLYRMRPTDPAQPFDGPLQAMALPKDVSPDTGKLAPGREIPVHWVDVALPTPSRRPTTRKQALAKGAAIVRRGEGIWYGDGSVFFTATIGGPKRGGQIFQLRLDDKGERLSVLVQSESPAELDMPDNLTVAPWGDLFVCEDGPGSNYLRRVTPDGRVQPFARNAKSPSELAGACFSPDGRALFVNLQHEGLTLLVTGPFERFRS